MTSVSVRWIALIALLLSGCYAGGGYNPAFEQMQRQQAQQQYLWQQQFMQQAFPVRQRTSCVTYQGGFNCF